MIGVKEVGVFGASVVLAGGVAYLIWNHAPFFRQTNPPSPTEERVENNKEEEQEKGGQELVEEETVTAVKTENTSTSRSAVTGTQVLVLGLEGSGKTSLLHCFSGSSLDKDTEPTKGFNAVSISKDDLHIEFLEIGGNKDLRPYWQRYLSKALLLVFVVDSSNPQLFPAGEEAFRRAAESSLQSASDGSGQQAGSSRFLQHHGSPRGPLPV
ncbi:ADP-ribosylation factor-like protein 9 [Oryzias melastigma]|uniref:ADP-ribosylation factor-like protein 9 n=1 Tax=Oryzias melastigma TaxID=30732 RepID=A0A834FDQ2_ORYME|nr:ADP-ribosylation factor-like protein 9 [Oryzias melastigma]